MWKHTKWCLLAPDANDGGGSSPPQSGTATTGDAGGADKGASPAPDRAALDAKLAAIVKEHGGNVEDSEDREVGPAETDQTAEPSDADSAEDATAEGTEGKDDTEVPFHEHPRWKEVLKQRDEAVATATKVTERLSRIDSYCDQHGITEEQFGQALEMAALLNNDPVTAYAKIQELAQTLAAYNGEKLPPDLQKAVDDGAITADFARQHVKLQNELALQQRRTDAQRQQSERSAKQRLRVEIDNAAAAWEQSVSKTDPDYPGKAEEVVDRVIRLRMQGEPRSGAEAVAMLQRAYEDVNKRRAALVKPPANGNGRALTSSSRRNLEPPKTALEAAQRAAARFTR